MTYLNKEEQNNLIMFLNYKQSEINDATFIE